MSRPALPPVVLLCGGLGLRQRSDVDDLPKPLRPLPDGRPLLLHVFDYYRAFGLTEFVLCVGYGATAVRELVRSRVTDPDLRLSFVDSGVEARKCVRLLDARPHVGERRFLLGYADVLSDLNLFDLLAAHEAGRGTVTLTATRVRSRFGLVSMGEGSLVAGFAEKPVDPALVSAGYFACEPTLFDHLAAELSFEVDVLPGLAARRELHALHHTGLWVTFDTYKDFVEAEVLADREGCPWLTPV